MCAWEQENNVAVPFGKTEEIGQVVEMEEVKV